VQLMIVGSGGVARALLQRLAPMWQVTLVDTDPERLASASQVRPVQTLRGDGSSMVVLRQAGIFEADALVTTTGNDDVNLEVCRLAHAAGLRRVVAVVADASRRPEYQNLGVPAFQPHTLAARQLELHLEPRRVSSTAFAQGRAEAIEVRVGEDSVVRGRALRDLASGEWLVAAILRDDHLVVPHGATTLEAGDVVTVVGRAADLPAIVRTFMQGEARFPLDFGRHVAVVLEGAGDLQLLQEAAALAHDSSATALLVVRRARGNGEDPRGREVDALLALEGPSLEGIDLLLFEAASSPAAALPSICASQSVGVVVMPAPARGRRGAARARAALRWAARLGRPVLFSRGSRPANGVVVPAGTGGPDYAFHAAVDLAKYAGVGVTAVAVMAPTFLKGGDEPEPRLVELLQGLRAEAAAQAVAVRTLVRRGNPVREIAALCADAGLLVLAADRRASVTTRPSVAAHLLARVEASILVLPSAK